MSSPQEDAAKKNAPRDGALAPGSPVFFSADGLRPFWALLLYLAILTPMVLYLVLGYWASASQTPSSTAAMHRISSLNASVAEWLLFGFIFFATWVMSRFEDRSVFDYGLQQSPRRYRWLAIGALWGLLFLSLLIAILWSTHHLVFTAVLLRPLPALGYGLAWAVAFIGVGFFEEFFFRGYLQNNLTRCFASAIRWFSPSTPHADAAGFWIAAVLISFGFGLIHKTNPGESPIGLLCAGLAGLVFAFSLWRTGALWWAIGLHSAWDWAQSFLYGVADSGGISEHHLLASHPAGSLLLSGGFTGPEGSVFVLPIMLLIALAITLTLPRNPKGFTSNPALMPESGSAAGGTLA